MSETFDTKKVHWLNLRYTEQQCPGMREILASAPADQQSALVRGILYQWCLVHKQQGTLEQAITTALNGPGVKGQRSLRRSQKERVKANQPAQARATTTHQQDVVPAQPITPIPAPSPQPPPGPLPLPEREQPAASDTAANALFNMFD